MELFDQSVARVKKLFTEGVPLVAAVSYGKDSTVVLAIALEAAIQAKADGHEPFLMVTHADTGVENPEMRGFADRQEERLRAFVHRHRINVEIMVATPALNASWAVRVLSGRGLPSFPGGQGDCTTDWKIKPMARLVKEVMSSIKARFSRDPVTLIGTRFDESVARGSAMRNRGERWDVPVRNQSGHLVLSCISNWTEDDVWLFVGEVMNGQIETFSDLTEMYAIYRDGGGGGCVVSFSEVSRETGVAHKKAGGCGARFGCHCCCRVAHDKSLESMIDLDPDKYGYMRGLNSLREYLIATRWDFNRRMWVGRSIIGNGFIAVQPDSYSPAFCLELLRLSLTLQIREIETAARLGIKPRFTLITLEALVLIDATWSLQGYHKPFQAIREWHEIIEGGLRYDVPVVDIYPRVSMPETRYYKVGDQWDEGALYASGLHCSTTDIFYEDGWSGGCMGHKTISTGAKDHTSYFFSKHFFSLDEMPDGATVGLPSMADVIECGHNYPSLKAKVVRGKAAEVLDALEAGEMDAVILPSKKLSAAQKAMAMSVGETSVVEGRTISVLDASISDEISVDKEGASLAMIFELESMLKKNAEASNSFGLTAGYRWWLQMGILSVPEGQLSKIDSVLRRTAFKERHGLAGANYQIEDVLAKAVSKAEFFKLSVRPKATPEEIAENRQAEIDSRRAAKRWSLRQRRVSIAELYHLWSPNVDWRSLISRKQLMAVSLPRKHPRNRFLVLRRFIDRYELMAFIASNHDIQEQVKAFRTSAEFRKATAPKKKRGRKPVGSAVLNDFEETTVSEVVRLGKSAPANYPFQPSLFDWEEAA